MGKKRAKSSKIGAAVNKALIVIFAIITISLLTAFISVLNSKDCSTGNIILFIVLLAVFGAALTYNIIALEKRKSKPSTPAERNAVAHTPNTNIQRVNLQTREIQFAEIRIEPSPYWRENVSDEVRERFATAIFLYNSRKGMPLGNTPNDYPQYYKYDLNVPHPEQLHRKLIADGMLATADIKTRLEALTVPQIKEILSAYNLPVSGKKGKLVETALENIPEEELDSKVSGNTLTMLTENGKSFLSFTEGYAELYRCGWGIYLYEYEALREQGVLNFSEAAEIILKQHDKSPSFSTKLNLAQLYYKQKEYDLSLRYYIQTMFYETCDEVIGFAPVTQERIHKMAEFFSEDMIEQCYKENPNAKSRMSKQRFVEAVHKALSGEDMKGE